MARAGRILFLITIVIVAVWGAGRLLIDVELPERGGVRNFFPDPMDSELSLEEAFAALPGGGYPDTQVRMLHGNAEAWAERWRLLAAAEQRLDVAYFMLKADVFGAAFLGHLLHKARQGVHIRVLLDAWGTKMSRKVDGNDYLDALVNAGNIDVRMYRPLRYRLLDAFLTLRPEAVIASEHDKILIADRRLALVGGRNIAAEYFAPPQDDPMAFHDADLLLAGEGALDALLRAFAIEYEGEEAQSVDGENIDLVHAEDDLYLAYEVMDAWLHDRTPAPSTVEEIRQRGMPWSEQLAALPHLRGALNQPSAPVISAAVSVLDSRTRFEAADDPITRSLIRLLRSAEREVLILSPYLVLPEEAVDVLAETVARDVEITILTNSPLSTDNPMTQGLFLEQWPRLLSRIPDLRLFVVGGHRNLHSKLAVIDRQISLVGTYNLDPISIAFNSELVIAVWSEAFAETVRSDAMDRIKAGAPQVYRYDIVRGADGEPLLDHDGQPQLAFGPADHSDPAQWLAAARWQSVASWGRYVLGMLPIF